MQKDAEWLDFNRDNYKKFYSPPGKDKLKAIFVAGFALILPFLKRDLFSRSPCRIIQWDANFDVAKKTMNDPEAAMAIKALVVLCGEYGHIMLWASCDAEGSNMCQNSNFWLKKRCEMLDLHVDGLRTRDYSKQKRKFV